MNILHLTYDYPDSINHNKTIAMKEIIDISLEKYPESKYVSLNRVSSLDKKIINITENGFEITTFGFPKGIMFRWFLLNSYKNVLRLDLNFKNIDLVHAHKLTFEGPIAYNLYKKYNIPYIISIQQTDFKILKIRKDLKFKYKKILSKAKNIIFISPWMKSKLKETLGSKFFKTIENKLVNIPLVVEGNLIYNRKIRNKKIVTAFNMKEKNIKIKNIEIILEAIRSLKQENKYIYLDIIGDGNGRNKIIKMIKEKKLDEQVKLIGLVKNNDIIEYMSYYEAFILCSFPETFGMVYIEALKAGLPIIHSKDAGVDGFFSEYNISIRVNHKSLDEIKDSILNINKKRRNIKELQNSCKLKSFSREVIKNNYINLIENIGRKYE
ncbi:glycosyltransferase [Clostridium perfringens]|uniref:glycosyltransferase n=1 Tax=Clostridium perfringens TaxID=1502 RepID=UPI000F8EBD07|nr:glycosyltransferase [Clostridium perfringens]RUR35226.1 glycosyltransferase [Clostridium perfringens]